MVERLTGPVSRRRFLLAAGAVFGAVLQACRSGNGASPQQSAASNEATAAGPPQALAPTPACGAEEAEVTVAQTEGPYFTPNSPERSNFRGDVDDGTPLVVTGAVLATDCTPVGRALVDVWHADAAGEYDNQGYRLRGHFFTDDQGQYRLETIVPGLYPGRTRHLHVKVQAPRGRVLTTQLYFPGETANRRDGIYRPELEMNVEDSPEGSNARFDFVLEV
ncbi:MAG TPA: intradiol ring-cleavage dioxygenase [Actinomycetota bacterium]|nr:intradiol ring-cleavage dioxygenase [Actinomycetota bacterium]